MNEPGLFTADYRSEPGRVEGWRGTPSFEDSVLDEIGEALRAIGGIGHTSGFDTFAGVIVTLRCIAEFEFGGCPTR